MTKQDLLRNIADTAYNVGFGAKKHFATYDITDKVPSVIGYVSTAVGVFALFMPSLATNTLSAAFIILGVLGISISLYDHKKEAYATAGTQLTQLFNKLKTLYFKTKAAQDADIPQFEQQLETIEAEFGNIGITDQILFSGWYAHYKFFWEHQIEWVDEQKHFTLFRDKLPLSFTASIALALIIGSAVAVCRWNT